MHVRKTQPVFRRRNFFQGRPIHGAEIKDLYWLKPDGAEMSDRDWASGFARCLGMVLPGDQIAEVSEHGDRIVGDSFAILLNAHREPISFRLGTRQRDIRWTCVLDTAESDTARSTFEHMSEFPLQARSLAVLRADLPTIPSKT
jgi:isoamylase